MTAHDPNPDVRALDANSPPRARKPPSQRQSQRSPPSLQFLEENLHQVDGFAAPPGDGRCMTESGDRLACATNSRRCTPAKRRYRCCAAARNGSTPINSPISASGTNGA